MSFCNNQGIVIIFGDFQNHSSLITLQRNHSESSSRSDSKIKYPEPNIDPQVPTRSHHNSRYEILLGVLCDALKANGGLIRRRRRAPGSAVAEEPTTLPGSASTPTETPFHSERQLSVQPIMCWDAASRAAAVAGDQTRNLLRWEAAVLISTSP